MLDEQATYNITITGDGNIIGDQNSSRVQKDSVDERAAGGRALRMARRSLDILEEQAAGYTTLTIPVHLKIELEEKRHEVAKLEQGQ
ncbi:MAG: hypothetical protein U9Q70_05830 [Chloroflexota bacterium]|nr:hypothetical protein [Chloroflexota bacterium]